MRRCGSSGTGGVRSSGSTSRRTARPRRPLGGYAPGQLPQHTALWTDLTRRAPDEVRTAAATMLAFSGWLGSNGAKA
ncbi:DUF4192 family protein [Actinomadura sp. 3N407]|uniref:DUF4192 family protein n=1 Tax=Actinomadura sp. 3N407 TaxID=3457423 RepID=UPI003FCD6291